MKEKIKYSVFRKILFCTGICMLLEIIYPAAALALTSGPGTPEFSSFEPVATTSMVNEFTGDFTYNLPVLDIPGANGGGYSMSLSYHSGENAESEASWVGYGWSLSPGAINRNKRGFHDDSRGDDVIYHNFVPKNWTTSLGASAGNIEAFSIDLPLSANATLRYNNYKGFGYTVGAGISYRKGLVSLGYSVTDGKGSFSAGINPAGLLAKADKDEKKREKSADYKAARKDKDKINKAIAEKKSQGRQSKRPSALSFVGNIGSSYGMHAFSDDVRPTTTTPYAGTSVNYSLSTELIPVFFPIGAEVGVTGSYSEQVNSEQRIRKGYGYLYSGDALAGSANMMDYFLEKESPYNKRDRYLAIPFSNADVYGLTGEGLGGGFRAYSKYAGHFRPNSETSITTIAQSGFEIQAVTNVGGGGDIGIGQQTLEVKGDWGDEGNTGSYAFGPYQGNEDYFFRFNNDMGGDIAFGENNQASKASVLNVANVPGFKLFKPHITNTEIASQNTSTIDGVNRSGRSSYVAYHTNSEMAQTLNGLKYRAYERNSSTDAFVKRDGASIKDGIGEFVVFNEEGNRYLYGLPVYSRNEKSLQYGLDFIAPQGIENNYLAYPKSKNISNPYKKVGEERSAPYATSYLLTEITTPDYVDRTMNGLDDDDFGGYTKFTYKQTYGTDNTLDKNQTNSGKPWYKWRIPYNGLSYSAGSLADRSDDMGAVSQGEKEVYYLQTVETKTHLAVFVTNKTYEYGSSSGKTYNGKSSISGSQTPRIDGLDAAADDVTAGTSKTAKGTHELEYLERIELYAKPRNGSNDYKLVKTTRFDYDNIEIFSDIPNAFQSSQGKLKLKKVWFEYDGITPATISPYKFEYRYPLTSQADYPAKYDAFENYMSASIQDPPYSPFDVDRWGNYQYNGGARHAIMAPWIDQTPPAQFDPAAWQLKVIKLPSGGEIHVQYEQDDYSYVQNRKAMAMVSLDAITSDNNTNEYFLNVADDLGITSPGEMQKVADLINEEFKDKKIYFKFLYKLLGTAVPELTDCNIDYVDGYVTMNHADTIGGKVRIKIGNGIFNEDSYELPKNICKDYVKTERGGKLKPLNNCNAEEEGITNSDAVGAIMELVAKVGTSLFPAGTCLKINKQLSYFRIPLIKAKKGGGLRVKRLLMFDKGIGNESVEDAALYGSEYSYQTVKGTSSGVASNEPSSGREENALITFEPKREEQKFFNKAVAGKDKEQFEGPIGESLLPSPSVGYSRVVVKNIHSGKTNTGMIVSEFYTTKEYPFDKIYNTATLSAKGNELTDIEQEKDWLLVPGGLVNISINNLWLSQGYRFVLNEMNGQPRAIATYAASSAGESLSSKQEFTYYEPGEQIPVMYDVNTIKYENPGKEMEVIFEKKAIEDVSKDGNIEFDLSVGLFAFLPIPFVSAFPSVDYTESKLRTHVTTKIIHYPAIQKSTLSFQDGIYHRTENIGFNPHTGKPILTKTTDGYHQQNLEQSANHDGSYHNYTFPASLQYNEMSQKAAGERQLVLSGSGITINVTNIAGSSRVVFSSADGVSLCDIVKSYTRGDLIAVKIGAATSMYHVTEVSGNILYIVPAANFNSAFTYGAASFVEIIRSGRTNQLNKEAGSLTTYGPKQQALDNPDYAAAMFFRQQFAVILNAVLTSGGGTIQSGSIPPGIQFLRQGGCQPLVGPDAIIIKVFSETISVVVQGCITVLLKSGGDGSFGIDPENGQLLYLSGDNGCIPQKVGCLTLCPDVFNSQTINVIAAAASTFDDNWSLYPYAVVPFGGNDYETGVRGKWRLQSSFVCKENIIGGSKQGTTERNYKDAGVYPITLFNWKKPELNNPDKWLRLNTVTRYSPNGEAVEEKDILNIYSAAKFGYLGTMPYLVAKNADYNSVQFESFENLYTGNVLEDGLALSTSPDNIDNTLAHSGKASLKLTGDGSPALHMKSFLTTPQIASQGVLIKVWVRDILHSSLAPVSVSLTDLTTLNSISPPCTKVAQVGEWALYEARATSLNAFANHQVLPKISTVLSGATIWIDDVRVQPYDAQVVNYVYDIKSLRLIASFDDQHFGLHYQYNAEGKLVRKLIETERGIKTITETQYHTPLESR